jgi:hypothetical protein
MVSMGVLDRPTQPLGRPTCGSPSAVAWSRLCRTPQRGPAPPSEPSADPILLAYLSAIMIMVGVSAFVFCRVMQPTVLGGGRFESALYRTIPASALTPGGNSDEAEQAAMRTAETENRDLQSQDLQVSRAVGKIATMQAKRAATTIKRVARTHRRNTRPAYDPRQSWARAWPSDQWSGGRAWSYGNDRGRNW